ncbi:MAG: hypothetical protein WC560_09285 [Syntrophales bacterium]
MYCINVPWNHQNQSFMMFMLGRKKLTALGLVQRLISEENYMIIVGEKINTSRKSIAEAVEQRDAGYIAGVAREQA